MLHLDRVTPETVIVDLPEKMVLEVETSGAYRYINWRRNGDSYSSDEDDDFPASPERFINFWNTYVRNPTSPEDLGLYRVELVQMGSQDTRNSYPVQFFVFPYGMEL